MTAEYEIELLIADFFRAFDAHDWPGVRGTLADELKIDYATPAADALARRGQSRQLRQSAPQRALHLAHQPRPRACNRSGSKTTPPAPSARFALKRFSADGERHFHSWGEFELAFARHERRGWRISSLAQMTWRSEGEPKLHAAGAAERKIA